MITTICHCDVCGKEVTSWTSFNINLPPDSLRMDVCDNCREIVRSKVIELMNSFKDNNND